MEKYKSYCIRVQKMEHHINLSRISLRTKWDNSSSIYKEKHFNEKNDKLQKMQNRDATKACNLFDAKKRDCQELNLNVEAVVARLSGKMRSRFDDRNTSISVQSYEKPHIDTKKKHNMNGEILEIQTKSKRLWNKRNESGIGYSVKKDICIFCIGRRE